MEKIIEIDGKQMRMVANAKVPRLYRLKFGRDMLLDMQKLTEGFDKAKNEQASIPFEALTIFENVAWLFLKEGKEEVGNDPNEWLENLDGMFSIYEVLPQIIDLWKLSNMTTSTPSKKG